MLKSAVIWLLNFLALAIAFCLVLYIIIITAVIIQTGNIS